MAVVTGAGSGIGRAVAVRLAAEGAAVAALDVAEDNLAATVDAIAADGGTAAAYRCDVTSESSVAETVAALAEQLGPPTRGVQRGRHRRLLPHRRDAPRPVGAAILAVNLTGPFLVCRATLPHLLEHGGSIVNVASNTALMGQAYSAAYCASKAGLLMFSKALAAEYLSRGVRVNVVAPGGVDTPLIGTFELPEGADFKELEQDHDADGLLHPGRDRRLGGLPRLGRVLVHHRGGALGRRGPDHLSLTGGPAGHRQCRRDRMGCRRSDEPIRPAHEELHDRHTGDTWDTDFDVLSPEYVADPYRIWDELRRTCPVAHTDRRGSTWLPTRYQDVVDLAHDVEHFSSTEITVIPFPGERARRAGPDLRAPPDLGRPAPAHLDPSAPAPVVLPHAGRGRTSR